MKAELFSQRAMDQLSTPEQLDRQVKLLSPSIWVLFAAVLVGVCSAVIWMFVGTISNGEDYAGVIYNHDDAQRVSAQTDGILHDVLVVEGDHIAKGDIIATIYNQEISEQIEELLKEQKDMEEGSEDYKAVENELLALNGKLILRSETEGIVQRVELKNSAVEAGDTVATLIPQSFFSYNEVYLYVPKEESGAFEVGMEAQITPSYVAREEYGYMEGVISSISEYIVSDNHILKHMGTLDYVEELRESDSCVEITIQLNVDV